MQKMIRPKPFGTAMFVSIATAVILVVFLIAAAMVLGLAGALRMVTARSDAHEAVALTVLSIACGLLVGPAIYAVLLLIVTIS